MSELRPDLEIVTSPLHAASPSEPEKAVLDEAMASPQHPSNLSSRKYMPLLFRKPDGEQVVFEKDTLYDHDEGHHESKTWT